MSPRKGKSTTLERGIAEHATGYRVYTTRGPQRERHFKKPMTRDELRNERQKLEDEVSAATPLEGTLAADVEAFLGTVSVAARKKDLARLLKKWTGVYGDQPRDAITAVMIDTQLATWSAQPKHKDATRRNLRQALGQFYRKMNGKSGRNPVADAAAIKPHYDEPRGLPYTVIALIFKQINDYRRTKKGAPPKPGLTKIRLRVFAYTGLPQAMIGRLQPRDVNLKKHEIYVRPRRKGGGAPARTFKLADEALAAFRDFVHANAWGKFSTRSMAKLWRKAVIKAQAEWTRTHRAAPWPGPADARAYDLRHSFASLVLEQTDGDQRAVMELLMHSTLEQSTRYTQSVASARSQKAITKIGGKMGGASARGMAPASKRQKTPQNANRLQAKRSA